MIIYCLHHIKFESFGNLKEWALIHDHVLETTDPSTCHSFLSPDEFDMLVIMGGTMSVYEEDNHPWLHKEKAFVREVLRIGKPILGICFGGQMLAQLLGAHVGPNIYKEIGWHNVGKTPQCNTFLKGLPDTFPVFQWHSYTFDIPEDAVRLFESEACKNQGFIYNNNVIGLQFHPEANVMWIKELIHHCRGDIVQGRYIQNEESMLCRETELGMSKKIMFQLLDILSLMKL